MSLKVTTAKDDMNTWNLKGSKERYLLGQKTCEFSEYSPLSGYKTTLKQQLNSEKRWEMRWRAKTLNHFWFLFSCWVLEKMLAGPFLLLLFATVKKSSLVRSGEHGQNESCGWSCVDMMFVMGYLAKVKAGVVLMWCLCVDGWFAGHEKVPGQSKSCGWCVDVMFVCGWCVNMMFVCEWVGCRS